MRQAISQTSQANTNSGGLKTAGTALAAFPDRMGYKIQNQAAAVLFIKYGAGCSTSDYDLILKACSMAADGTGGADVNSDAFCYTGVITVAASGTPSYTAMDF